MKTQLKSGLLRRAGTMVYRQADDDEPASVEIAFSSEEPVDRWFGVEILDHAPRSVRLDRIRTGGALLVDHDPADVVGVVEKASVDPDRRARAVARLGRSERAAEITRDIEDGIRRHVSVGYRLHRMTLEESSDDGPDVYRATDWEPYEISIVSIPADYTVGIGRGEPGEYAIEIEDHIMTKTTTTTEPPAAPATDPDPVADAVRTAIRTPAPAAVEPEPPVRVQTSDDAVASDRARMKEIRELAKLYPQTRDLADQAQLEGWTADRFRQEAMPLIASKGRAAIADEPVTRIGLTDSEAREFSLMRAIRAMVRAKTDGLDPAKFAPFEFECSRAVAANLEAAGADREPRGIMVPYDVQQRTPWLMPRARESMMLRAPPMDTTENVHLVGTDHLAANFIDALRARTVLVQAGAIMLPGLVGNVSIPKLAGSSTYGWVAEDGNSTDNDPATAAVTMSPKTVTSSVSMTRRLMLQSSPAVEQIIRNDLVQGAAIAIDDGGINGGANAPTGILNETGVGTVSVADFGAGAGIPTWAEAVEFETVTDTSLALMGAATYVTTPAVSGGMKTQPKDAGSGLFVQEGMDCNGYPVARTTLMAAKTILFGDYSQALIGMWGVLDINVDVATKAQSGGVVLRAFQDVDVAVRHGQAFTKSVA